MSNSPFHKRSASQTLKEIAELLGVSCTSGGDKRIQNIKALHLAEEGDLSFLDNPKYLSALKETKASAVILSQENAKYAPEGVSVLISSHPYASYAKALQYFYPQRESSGEVSAQSFVHPTAKIGENVQIEPFACIQAGAVIGANSIIGSGSFVGENVHIGDHALIGTGVKIQCAIIGHHVMIHSNAAIGQDGFGFAWDGKMVQKVPQIGEVHIGNYVEIGACTTIDRGSLGRTEIGDMTKIDNLVQVAHNVKIGRGCQIVSQAGIAGSTELGDGVIVGGQAGFAGHLKVASHTTIAAKAGVVKNVEEEGTTLAGFPSMAIAKWRRLQVMQDKSVQPKDSKK